MKAISILTLGLLALSVTAQRKLPGESLRAADLPLPRLIASANRTLLAAGLRPLSLAELRWTVARVVGEREVSFKTNTLMVDVDPADGAVLMIYNQERSNANYRGIGRSGSARFASRAQAKPYLWALARKLGLRSDARMVRLDVRKDGAVRDSNSTGYLAAIWQAPGYSMSISCDVRDGVLLVFNLARSGSARTSGTRAPSIREERVFRKPGRLSRE